MKGYEKPVAVINNEISEGVYAVSGSSDCWTVTPVSVQDWNGSHHVFEIRATHSKDVEHISDATTVTLTFSSPLIDAYAESFSSSFSGNTVVIKRESLANAYKSGDNVTYKVWAQAEDEATTKALTCTASIICTKVINVQGNGGDGN